VKAKTDSYSDLFRRAQTEPKRPKEFSVPRNLKDAKIEAPLKDSKVKNLPGDWETLTGLADKSK